VECGAYSSGVSGKQKQKQTFCVLSGSSEAGGEYYFFIRTFNKKEPKFRYLNDIQEN